METLGMNLTEGKALLAGVQDFVVSQQAREESELLASAVGRAFSTSQNRQSRAGCALGMSFGHSGLSEPRDLGRSRRQYDREKRAMDALTASLIGPGLIGTSLKY